MRVDEKVVFTIIADTASAAQTAALVELYRPGRNFSASVEDKGYHHEHPKHIFEVTLRPDWRGPYDGS